ncbi:MAG: D-amino-acid transaminase [Anaerolineales bacterium]
MRVFEITPRKNIPLQTSAQTLDEWTRGLPQGFYTTFITLARAEKVFGLSAHLARLFTPAAEMNLRLPVSAAELRARLSALAKLFAPQEARVRLLLTKGTGRLYAALAPFSPPNESTYQNGVAVLSVESARHDPRIKDSGFIAESAAQRKLLSDSVYEILLSQRGKILEGMTSNFYVIVKDTLITARQGILLGVTRRVALRVARGEGLSIEYRAPSLTEGFSEAFLTSSSRGIVPIVSIDGMPVGEGKVGEWTKRLIKAYGDYVARQAEGW